MNLPIPKWRIILYGCVLGFIVGYLVYSCWPHTSQPVGVMQQAKTVIPDTLKVPVPAPKIIKVIEPRIVYKYLPTAQIAPSEKAVATAEIPDAPNGAKVLTTIDDSGEARTQYQLNDAPWFALERGNELGVGCGISTSGRQAASVHYRRDLFRIKDVHVTGQVEINAGRGDKTEGTTWLMANWRF
jgi:hypothetical protein